MSRPAMGAPPALFADTPEAERAAFFEALTKGVWEQDSCGCIRELRTRACPLCFAALQIRKRWFEPTQWETAADVIGIEYADADVVSDAADFPLREWPSVQQVDYKSARRHARARQELLAHCGLSRRGSK